MTTSSATPTSSAEASPPSGCPFLEGKYFLALHEVMEAIKNTTPLYTNLFIRGGVKKEYAGMSITLVPKEIDVHHGFEITAKFSKSALQVPYGSASVGHNFHSEIFKNTKNIPGKTFSGFSIYLPTEYKEMLDAIPESNTRELENLWDKENLSDKIKVNYINEHGNFSTGSTLEFAYWFAHTLATHYLTWCKENQTLSVSTTPPLAADYDTESDSEPEATSAEANPKVNKRDPQQEEEPIAKRLRSNTNANNNKRFRNGF